MGHDARKPVFGVSNKVRFKPVSSALGTSLKIKISLVASLDIILSKKRIKKGLISLRLCCLQPPPKTGFLASRPILYALPCWILTCTTSLPNFYLINLLRHLKACVYQAHGKHCG